MILTTNSAILTDVMARDLGTTLERQTPSGELRQFLDPLNPGEYFDHGPARLYGIDEVLELEARRRGRQLGEDEFQLVATDGGLIFCRASICFAIAARWRDLALHRPDKRLDESGRVDLAVDWPTHGELTFTVTPRLGTNIYRRWLHLREQDDKRAHVSRESGLEIARNTDPHNPVTVVLDEDTKQAIMGELAPDDIVIEEISVDSPAGEETAGDEGPVGEDPVAEEGAHEEMMEAGRIEPSTTDSTTPSTSWTEPGLELTGGETLFVLPERSDAEHPPVSALSTIDPDGLDLNLDAVFMPEASTSLEHHPTDLMPSVEGPAIDLDSGTQSEPRLDASEDVDEIDALGQIDARDQPDPDELIDDRGDSSDPIGDHLGDDGVATDPNQTIRRTIDREEVDAERLLHFDVESEDNGAVEPAQRERVRGESQTDGVFSVERPTAVSPDGNGPGVRDADFSIGSFKRPDNAERPTSGRPSRSASKPFAGGIRGSSVDGDTTLAEIWHRNRVSIIAGVSLVVLAVVALSSLLNRGDDGGEVEAGADIEITIPERSGSISLPSGDPLDSTSTTEPRAPLVIEGLTTVAGGVEGATGAAGLDDGESVNDGAGQSDSTEPEDSNEGQSGDVAICHSNYGGCVPVAADVDCVGDGDGPAFLSEAVVVFGEDVYNLDTDDDREACELGQPLSSPPGG